MDVNKRDDAHGNAQDDALDALAVLADPVRRALFRYVAAAGHDVGRAEAADAVGVQRTLAAHHLDKLAEVGLVDVAFARPAGRSGPGAGRPAKYYRASAGEVAVSVPRREYDAAGLVLADALERLRADDAVAASGRAEGRAAGRAFRAPEGVRESVAEQRERLAAALRARGYEPVVESGVSGADESGADASGSEASGAGESAAGGSGPGDGGGGVVRLRNCPFHRLAEQFPPLVCGMNLALLEGLVEGVGASAWRPRIGSGADGCCVVLEVREGAEASKNNDD
ncbi:helix-turn-helix transcriptional regulator [Yinghuangia soli]|uniref:Transcriptional regulator n=1 Tax=Yinghuangia soli TaxID=2908204 RepID=A0AA41Q5Z9_9ACTN|nr:transcriptional regulator [Yinghuangia soli]MCF2532203.1 transcriptional regulator [Yinghuangia soli]